MWRKVGLPPTPTVTCIRSSTLALLPHCTCRHSRQIGLVSMTSVLLAATASVLRCDAQVQLRFVLDDVRGESNDKEEVRIAEPGQAKGSQV